MWNPVQDITGWAASLLDSGFVIIDLETTALTDDPRVDIVEVGIINHRGDVLMETLVKPKYPISPRATSIHGISNSDVADAPGFEKIYQQLADILNEQDVVAYNHTFEQGILATVCRRYEKPVFTVREWHCAMRAYAAFHRGHERWIKLETACRMEHIAVQNIHRAMGDCRMTLALMQKMAARATK